MKKINLSLVQRLTLSFVLLIGLVLVAIGVGGWYAIQAGRVVNTAQAGVTQIERLAELQFVWSEVAATIDNMLLTRQAFLAETEVAELIDEFNHQLENIETLPLGQNPQLAAENQQIVENLQILGSRLDRIVAELTTLAQERRWARAQALRHTEMVSFQRRFDEELFQLNDNTRDEVDRLVTESLQAQRVARTSWFVTIIVAALVGVASAVVATRSITRPVKTLISQAERVTRQDFSPISPLEQQDEIGELSRTFALMTDWLRESYQTLELRVQERTRRLEIIATLSERLNAILNLDELLPQIIDQIQENFGYYHAHIYLVDEDREKLVVAAGTGRAGAEMKRTGHSIAINASSLVARAARTEQVVWVDNVTDTSDWLPNPLLPYTQSEMVVPIIIDGQVEGVLDVQENKVSGFDEGDANLLRSLASQVGVAIRNARLFESVETALAEARTAQERYLDQVWEKAKIISQGGRYLYTRSNSQPPAEPEQAMMARISRQTSEQDQAVIIAPDNDNPEKQALAAPINFRDKTIGTLQLHASAETTAWDDDDLTVVEAIVSQFAQIAENLRLFEETKERASRERLIGQISDKLRRAQDFETLMKVGVDELARALGPERVFVRLGSSAELARQQAPDQSSPAPPPQNGATNGREDSHE